MSIFALRRGIAENIGFFSATGVGFTYTVPAEAIGARIAWQVSIDSAPTALTVVLEGSLDGTNFFQIDTTNSLTGYLNVLADLSVPFIRAHVTTLTGGSVSVFARAQ